MIDVHEVKCNTPCNYGLKYPCLLNNIWRTFLNSKSSSIQSQSPTVPPYYIQSNNKSNKIYLTYGPALGWTQPDNGADAPYNFAVPAKIEEDAVMFIGMNPSYIPSNSNNNYDDYWDKGNPVNNIPVQLSDSIDSTTGWQFEKFYDNSSIFGKSPYFEDLRKLTTAFYRRKCEKKEPDNTNYAHLDLLAIRHTTQEDIEDALKKYYINKGKSKNGNPRNKSYDSNFEKFINAQIDIFKELLQAAKPKVIIVNSGLASNILRNNEFFFQKNTLSTSTNNGDWQGLRAKINMRLSWDDNISAYRWVNPTFSKEREVNNEKGIPVFLCGMTSGQRALDSGRREELIAQVAKVI